MFVGSWLSGAVVQHYSTTLANGTVAYQWRTIWLVPAGISVVILLLFLATFKDRSASDSHA
jgi:hypothetical protein